MSPRKILVPIATDDEDGLYLGTRAARVALRLADTGDELVLLSVLPPATEAVGCHDNGSTQRNAAQSAGAQRRLDEVAASLSGEGPTVTTRLARSSDPAEEIVRASADANLLVMPSHARRGVRRFLHGSVAQQVAGQVDIPVHIICGDETTARQDRADAAVRQEKGA